MVLMLLIHHIPTQQLFFLPRTESQLHGHALDSIFYLLVEFLETLDIFL